MIAFENIPNRDGANAGLITNLVGKWNLEHPPVDRFLGFADLTGGAIDHIRSCGFEEASDLDRAFRSQPARCPAVGGNAHAHGPVLRPGATDRGKTLPPT